jgi:hypothetical protein
LHLAILHSHPSFSFSRQQLLPPCSTAAAASTQELLPLGQPWRSASDPSSSHRSSRARPSLHFSSRCFPLRAVFSVVFNLQQPWHSAPMQQSHLPQAGEQELFPLVAELPPTAGLVSLPRLLPAWMSSISAAAEHLHSHGVPCPSPPMGASPTSPAGEQHLRPAEDSDSPLPAWPRHHAGNGWRPENPRSRPPSSLRPALLSSAQHLPPPSTCARTAADPQRPPLLLLSSPQNSGSSPHLPSLRSPSMKRHCSCSPDTFPGFLAASAARMTRVRRSVQVGC